MRSLLNHNSLLIAGAFTTVVAWALLRKARKWLKRAVIVAIVVAVAAFGLARRTGGGDVASAADLERTLGTGTPVLLEFYSDL